MFDNTEVKMGLLPAIPVRGIVVLPNVDVRIEVGREISKSALESAENDHDGYVLLLVQENAIIENPVSDDFLKYGVVAKVNMKIKLPGGNFKVKFTPIVRIQTVRFLEDMPFFMAEFVTEPSQIGNQAEEYTLTKLVVNEVIENANIILKNKKGVLDKIQSGVSSDVLSDIVAFNMKMPEDEKLKYLKMINIDERLKEILKDIEREKYLKELENKINQDVKKNIDQNQKEYYLREKMKAIQDELGDKANKEHDIVRLREAIMKVKMPKNIEKKALYELSRYETLPASSGESGVIRTYLDLVVSLPWRKKTKDIKDIKKAEEALDSTHFGLEKVKERILEYLAVKLLTGKNPQTILCLVGPPGVGKTSLAKSISDALGRKFVKQSLGGVKDESEIRGHRRTYLGALPGRIIQGMKKAGVVNPVFLLDEVDKLGSDYKGDPSAALLEVLDPEQNHKFSDHYLEEQYDLSQVLFIATANYLGNIPAPLRDRMEIIELSSYTEIEKYNIAVEHLISKQLEVHGLDDNKFTIEKSALYKIIREYTREAGVRQLDRIIGSLVRKAIKQVLGEKVEMVIITTDNLDQYLGKAKFNQTKNEQIDYVGVVNGLAYTQYGGDTLAVEVTYYKGNGKLVLTGKLGEVMKESAQAALSYVKSNSEKYGIDTSVFLENDVHVHVPEGAVPKDGPSAGVTMTTAIVSALTNKKVDHNVGMTGEITLRGRVLPIGGLKEKSIAARRSGLTKIMIPMENKRDLEDLPKDVLENLEIVPVDSVDEIIKTVLI